MSPNLRIPLITVLAPVFVTLVACARGDGPMALSTSNVVVSGEVIEVRDETPVDGGVTITVTTQTGGRERLVLPPFVENTSPPSQQTLNLYDLVRRVEVRDQIRAAGKRTVSGVELESLSILAEHV